MYNKRRVLTHLNSSSRQFNQLVIVPARLDPDLSN